MSMCKLGRTSFVFHRSACQNIRHKSTSVVIIGGGTAGIGVAAKLKNEGLKHITIIEPNENHFYQPTWTLIGAGLKKPSDCFRSVKDILPTGVSLISKAVTSFKPQDDKVVLSDGSEIQYDFLVIAAGLQLDWKTIPGLAQAVAQKDSGVVSIYDHNYAQNAWRTFNAFKSGNMLFTTPNTPLKCAGAPMKIMFEIEELLRDKGIRSEANVVLHKPPTTMFGVQKYSDLLEKERLGRDIAVSFQSELVAVDAQTRTATFRSLADDSRSERPFDVLHVTPPMSAPDFLQRAGDTGLVDAAGFVMVDPQTLRSNAHPNVFAIGDCSNTPNSKTAAAVICQSTVLSHNLLQAMQGEACTAQYSGYSSCPLIVGKNQVILAEFGYDGVLMETFAHKTGKFPFSLLGQECSAQNKFQRWFFSRVQADVFPWVYWHLYLKGLWYGPTTVFRPKC